MTCLPRRDARKWNVRDWRGADPALLRACYDIEERHWLDALAWDTSWTWSTIERARVTWGLPGLLALDDAGRVLGWAFYMMEGRALRLGGLVADDEATTTALLERALDAATGDEVDLTSCFVLERAPGLTAALTGRGFEVERFLYLSRALPAVEPGGILEPGVASGFSPTLVTDSAALLQRAYSPDTGRHLAPNGTLDEWTKYVDSLVHQRGCGVLDHLATRVRRDDRGLRALALVTSLSPTTAHLAQLAVRPDGRGEGVGAALVREASERAAGAGKTRMTLLVGERNLPARRLYASMGFTDLAVFVAGTRSRSCAARGISREAVPACG